MSTLSAHYAATAKPLYKVKGEKEEIKFYRLKVWDVNGNKVAIRFSRSKKRLRKLGKTICNKFAGGYSVKKLKLI